MRPGTSCPDSGVLVQLVLGRLSAPESEPLEQHLASCPVCAAALERLPGDDELVRSLRQPLRPDETANLELVTAVIPALKRLRRQDGTTPAAVSRAAAGRPPGPAPS